MKYSYLSVLILVLAGKLMFGQNFTEILGRPTNSSVTMSILFDAASDVYWEYGTSPGYYTGITGQQMALKDTALEVCILGLAADMKFFYRTRYRLAGSIGAYLAGPEHSFQTARYPGSRFTFAVEADPHLDTNSNFASYSLTLQNILAAHPDFMFDLGDNFMSEKLTDHSQAQITARHLLYRSYFGAVCHSVPLFLTIGNHEGELGWMLDGTPGSLPVMASNTRKSFYPNPLPVNFYSGDTIQEPFVGLRENYYAWEWGNALFIVLDPYWYTMTKPDWGWTLGEDQYNWFKNIISNSNADFKFVFCHQLIGGSGTDGRGGSEYARFFENGGENTDSTWGFDAHRPGWVKPVHDLMVENNAAIFFHGHDHCYAKQDLDGIVYQEVPQPSSKNITNITGTQYGYVNGILMPGRGYLLVTITDTTAKVDYVKTYLPSEVNASHINGDTAFSYIIHRVNASTAPRLEVPGLFSVMQNQPNPFSGVTSIAYSLRSANPVQIDVFDMYGRAVRTLVKQYQQTGNYSVSVDAEELSMTPGFYFCRICVGGSMKCLKMICISTP